ncbi:MAG: hypothetical protein ACC628_01935, partial [Pirellulaceae bacterium]
MTVSTDCSVFVPRDVCSLGLNSLPFQGKMPSAAGKKTAVSKTANHRHNPKLLTAQASALSTFDFRVEPGHRN